MYCVLCMLETGKEEEEKEKKAEEEKNVQAKLTDFFEKSSSRTYSSLTLCRPPEAVAQ